MCITFKFISIFASFLLSCVDKCIKEYYSYDYSDNNAQKISFAKSKCLHIIKSNKASWLRVWFNTTGAKNEPLVNLDVILKDLWGRQRRQWNLRSENVRNFIAEEKGDWFEIEEPESGSNRWFHLKFKLYSAGKSNTLSYFSYSHP